MAIDPIIKYSDIDDLNLDPLNPRLGRRWIDRSRPQDELLKEILSCNLEEIAHSFVEAKVFWPQEAVIVVEEELYGGLKNVVVEGNRRIATLKWLRRCKDNDYPRRSWKELFPTEDLPDELFEKIPYFIVEKRADVDEFLGFRHVTGIKPWSAADKAYFMAQLLERGESYDDVRKAVGSTTPTVKSNYLAYRVLLQIENIVEDFDPDSSRNRFTPLYMSLKLPAAQEYLSIPHEITPNSNCEPIPATNTEQLQFFARWIFGNEESEPLITDTRQIAKFGKALQDSEARGYLERDPDAKLEIAIRMSGDELEDTIEHVRLAGDYAGVALSTAHLYGDSPELREAIERLSKTSSRLKEAIKQ